MIYQPRGPLSTETALLKIQNDLLRNLDDEKTTVLVLLDLSAAFDTLDYSGVIGVLEDWHGISIFLAASLDTARPSGQGLRNSQPCRGRWASLERSFSGLMDQQRMVKVKKCVGEHFQTKYLRA